MGKDDRDEVARRELKHAIEALSDGAGQETWGPGPVGSKLFWKSIPAALAFDTAASSLMILHRGAAPRTLFAPAVFIEKMRMLAPVMLEIVLTAEEAQRDNLRQVIAELASGY